MVERFPKHLEGDPRYGLLHETLQRRARPAMDTL
jgi:hypothetical protein